MSLTPSSEAKASTPHRVAIAGASGRMGHMLIEAVRAADDCVLAGALDIAASPAIGADATAFLGHASGVVITSDLATGLAGALVLIDFTRPEGTLAHLAECRRLGVNMVIGTTGLSDAQKATIAEAAGKLRFSGPFVLKGLGFAHKTEAGAVRLGLASLEGEAEMVGATGYLVEEGETLDEIARRFHTTEGALRSLNRLGDSDNIYPGRYMATVLPSVGRST